jgi:hypothetical protein
MLSALLPVPARWLTKSLNALLAPRGRGLFSRHEKIFPVTATVVTAGEEPGSEEHREGQYDEYDNGDKACPDPPVCSLGRIGRRGRSCRFVSRLQCLGRTFITRHAAALRYNRERNCALISKPAETRVRLEYRCSDVPFNLVGNPGWGPKLRPEPQTRVNAGQSRYLGPPTTVRPTYDLTPLGSEVVPGLVEI